MRVLRLAPARWWTAVVAAVLATSLGARAAAGGVPRWVLATDAAVLAVGAVVIRIALRAAALTPRARQWQAGLAALLALGAVRAVVWAAGAPVQWANLAALAVALVVAAAWVMRRRRAAALRAPAG